MQANAKQISTFDWNYSFNYTGEVSSSETEWQQNTESINGWLTIRFSTTH